MSRDYPERSCKNRAKRDYTWDTISTDDPEWSLRFREYRAAMKRAERKEIESTEDK